MHELSIASSLVEKLLEFAEQNPDKRIVEVKLAAGEFSHVEEEQLRFCYAAVTTGTALDGSTLKIENIEGQVECGHCQYHGRPKYLESILTNDPVATLECPACGKAAESVEGNDCAIKSIKFVRAETMMS